jgi:hypothetical protein
MPTTSFEKFSRTITRALNSVGQSLRALIVTLVKLGLLALFFGYLLGFALELLAVGGWGVVAMIFVILATILCLVIIGWAVESVANQDWKEPFPSKPTPESVWPFVALVLLPLVIIVVANHGFGYSFGRSWLKVTQDQVNQLLTRML